LSGSSAFTVVSFLGVDVIIGEIGMQDAVAGLSQLTAQWDLEWRSCKIITKCKRAYTQDKTYCSLLAGLRRSLVVHDRPTASAELIAARPHSNSRKASRIRVLA